MAVVSFDGKVFVASTDTPLDSFEKFYHRSIRDRVIATLISPSTSQTALFGFGYFRTGPGPNAPSPQFSIVAIPYWFVVLITAAGPAFWYWLVRRRALQNETARCTVCGYDLRASAGRCPECGTSRALAPPQ